MQFRRECFDPVVLRGVTGGMPLRGWPGRLRARRMLDCAKSGKHESLAGVEKTIRDVL
jgi:hypothetical protein